MQNVVGTTLKIIVIVLCLFLQGITLYNSSGYHFYSFAFIHKLTITCNLV